MKLIILDRDGVINEDSDAFIKSPEEWIPIPGSLDAIARLNQAGYQIAVASNQSGLARGLFSLGSLQQMHDKFQQLLAAKQGQVEIIKFCPHGPDEDCDCRKPKPGLLLQIAAELDVPLTGVPVVGDSLRDLESAVAVGAQPILVKTGKGKRTLAAGDLPQNTQVYADLSAVAEQLCGALENG